MGNIMENNEVIKDFGSINVPDGWDKITLKKYQEIEAFYEEREDNFNVIDVLDIMIDKDKDYIQSLPAEFLDMILDKLSFLAEKPEVGEPTNKIKIDGETYIIHFENQLKVGEYIAADTILKSDKHNYAALLAILCRKEGEAYDSKFENEIIEDRIKLWEKQPVINVMPLIGFFLMLSNLSLMPTLLSSSIEEMVSHIAKNIETLHQNGEISKRSMKSQMKKLKKLQKSIKCI
ncbi:MAG: hypothetical protein IKE95_09605 [Methanobrevibacter sp.]|nr:hypothetical protein [Methanobrevibacter sp.]